MIIILELWILSLSTEHPRRFVQLWAKEQKKVTQSFKVEMILTFQTSFPTVDEEERFADINVPETRTVDDVKILTFL